MIASHLLWELPESTFFLLDTLLFGIRMCFYMHDLLAPCKILFTPFAMQVSSWSMYCICSCPQGSLGTA